MNMERKPGERLAVLVRYVTEQSRWYTLMLDGMDPDDDKTQQVILDKPSPKPMTGIQVIEFAYYEQGYPRWRIVNE